MYFGQRVFVRDGVLIHGTWKPYQTWRDAFGAGCTLISVLALCVSVAEYEAWLQEHRDAGREPGKQRLSFPFRGPLYMDFDAPDEQETLKRRLGARLEDLGRRFEVDPGDFHLFFSGNKGFHLEIPAAVFGPSGFQHAHLPSLYREMVQRLGFGDLADMAVYSESRGRLWRAPGRLRENGYRKIPLTWAQFRKLSFKQIKVMSRLQRTKHFIQRQTPKFSQPLADVFEQVCRDFERGEPKRRERAAKSKARQSRLQPLPSGQLRLPREAREEIETALAALPDALVDAYESWIKIGMALHTGTEGSVEGLELWMGWSRRSAKFDADEVAAKWMSFQTDAEHTVGLGTLFFLADRYS